jgi:glycerol-3-phosphate acyltransferase PlsY
MPWIILAIAISYLVGSIPTAYLFGRILKEVDIRKFGSGNVGATNALRVLGKKVGITVLLIDVLKGVFPVIILGDYILAKGISFSSELSRIILGLSCICGHNWTVFLNFKGGKGVATTFGVLIGLSFRIAGFAKILGWVILIWFSAFILFRIVSLASVLAAITFPLAIILSGYSRTLVIFSLLTSIFILLRHRSNLVRIFQGKEPRLSFRKSKPA